MYFLKHCLLSDQYGHKCLDLLNQLQAKYKKAIEQGNYEPIDIVFLNKFKDLGLIKVTTPKIAINPLSDVFSSWQSIVYEGLIDNINLPSPTEIQEHIDAININMPVKQLSLQGLSALGINLIQRASL